MADLSVTAASVLKGSGAMVGAGIAGATITAGQALYIDTADGNKLKLADSDGTSPANSVAGIALHGASAGQPIQYATEDASFTPGCTLSVGGGSVYLSDTPGGITQTIGDLESGDKVISLGVPLTTTTMYLKPVVGGTI